MTQRSLAGRRYEPTVTPEQIRADLDAMLTA